MERAMATPAARGTGERLRRDVIVATAAAQIDRYGPHGVTMRAVGRQLGVEAMSLYRYVRGREDLLEAVTSVYLTELREGVAESAARTWQDYLQTVAAGARQIALQHPHAWALLVTRQFTPPWLPPPLRSLGLVEDLLATLSSHGFSDTQVVTTYRGLSSFLLGQLLAAPAADAAKAGTSTGPGRRQGGPPPTHQSTVDRLGSLLRQEQAADEFDRALQMFLHRVKFGLDSASRDRPHAEGPDDRRHVEGPDDRPHAEGPEDGYCDSSSSSRSSNVSNPASNSSRL